MIYFAQAVGGGPIKIGCSVDVDTRIRALEHHYKQPLVLLATMPGGRDEERMIHEKFAEHRLRRTEQFRPAAEIMEFIGRPLLVGADPDAVEVMETELDRPRQTAFRFDEETMSMIDELVEYYSRESGKRITRTGVVEQAIREMAERRRRDH